MSITNRKHHSSEFKAKVSLEAIRGDLTLSELSCKYGVHSTLISKWKSEALASVVSGFSGSKLKPDPAQETKELHRIIGKLMVECDFLQEAYNRFK